MALILPRSIFIHIPKTGGMWVRAALQKTGLPLKEARHRHHNSGVPPVPCCCRHSRLRDVAPEDRCGRIAFAFVRHPLSLYQSWWAFKMKGGWNEHFDFERRCKSDTFPGFVEKVLTHFPGWAGTLFGTLVKDGVNLIGRQERLMEDLMNFLILAGEQFDPDALHSTPPQNVAGLCEDWNGRACYTPDLQSAVLESERDTLRWFGYGMQAGEVIGSCTNAGVCSPMPGVA